MKTVEEFIDWYAKNWMTASNGQIEDKINELTSDERARLRRILNVMVLMV